MMMEIKTRAAAFGIAALMFMTFPVSCAHTDSSRQESSDTSAYAGDAEYYPVTKECHYDENGKMTEYDEYEYDANGYLLETRHYSDWYGEMVQLSGTKFHYDEAGKMLELIQNQRYVDCGIWNYCGFTEVYQYDDAGRQVGLEFTSFGYDLPDDAPGKTGVDLVITDQLVRTNQFTTKTVMEYFADENDEGYFGRETTYDEEGNVYPGTADSQYTESGDLLWRKDLSEESQESYEAYEYDGQGRPIARLIRYIGVEEQEDGSSVPYSHTRICRLKYDAASRLLMKTEWYDDEVQFHSEYQYDSLGNLKLRSMTDRFGVARYDNYTYDENGALSEANTTYQFKTEEHQHTPKRTEYINYDQNGQYCTILYYEQNERKDWQLIGKTTLEYGSQRIPRGKKYGIAGRLAENEKLSVFQVTYQQAMDVIMKQEVI